MGRIFLLIVSMLFGGDAMAQSCTQASQASAGNCAGAPATTAFQGGNITGGTTFTYVKDTRHFDNYTINSGATLVICDGGKLDINNLGIYGGNLYVHAGGTIQISNLNGNAMTITNYGTVTCASNINTSTGDNIFNAGIFYLGGLTIQSSGVLVTNASAGVLSLTVHDLNINTGGLVNNGHLIDINNMTINSGGICLGDNSVMECNYFNNNSSNSLVVNSGTAGLIINNNSNNNQPATNTSNTLNVAIGGGCGGGPNNGNWGTADTSCNTTTLPTFPTSSRVFYSKSTGSLNTLGTWGDQPDGSGNSPVDFTTDEVLYIMTNRTTAGLSADWTISGKGTVVAIGDNAHGVTFNIDNANVNFNAAVAVVSANSVVNVSATRAIVFANESSLWITSVPEGDGSIGLVNGSFSGLNDNNVIMNRYIPDFATREWSFLASPLSSGTIANNWQQQIHVTGPAGTGGVACSNADSTSFPTANSSDGLDPTATGNYSMYYFDPNVAPGTTGQWKPVTNTVSTSTPEFQLSRGNGFRVLARGPRSLGCYMVGTAATTNGPARREVTLRSFGSIADVSGGASATLPYSTSNGNVYVMLGNPYIGALDFDAFQADASNSSILNDKYWLYSPEFAAGSYSAYASGVLTNRPSNYAANASQDAIIGTWQAVIVELASAGSGSFTFKQNFKYTTSPFVGTFKTTATPIPDLLHVALQTTTGERLDEAAIRFVNDPGVTNANYSGYDAISMNGTAAQFIETIKDTFKMSIQAREPLVTTDTVALNIGSYIGGNFQFKVSGPGSFINTDIYLLDRLNSTVQHLNSDSDYTFTIDLSNTASFGANRFAVIFKKWPVAVFDPGVERYKVYPLPVSDKLNLELPGNNEVYTIAMTGMTGNVVYKGSMNAGLNTIDVRSFAAGAYVLKITDAKGGTEMIKIIKY